MTRLIFLGPPGAGKGTQAQVLSGWLAVPHISTGAILRTAVSERTPLGQRVQDFMDRGDLVPDALILELVEERLAQADTQSGWVLDGFPRNLIQADQLEALLARIGQTCDCVLNLEVPDAVLVSRLLDRGRREGRSDDTDATIQRRLRVYQEQTAPLLAFYRDRQQLASVNGDAPIDAVTASLKAAIQARAAA